MAELRPGWQRVRFGQVVRLVSDRCDPVTSGIERFVGLEHIESGDLKVRSWGDVADGTTFTNRFRPGQVLFGKRRAYQRKVAIAEFDGVCSGDIYVLESADSDRLLPELLPFLCQTDAFFEHAVGTSAGSLSPRTNWTSLASFEFTLPPLAEQHRIVHLLSAGRAAREATSELATAAARVADAHAEELMSDAWKSSPRQPLPSLCEVLTVGIVVTPAKFYVESDGVPVLRSLNVWPGRFALEDLKRISNEGHALHSKSRLRAGDLAIVRTGDPGRPGNAAVVPQEMDGWNCVDLVLARPSPQVRPEYLADFINWSRSRRVMEGLAPGTKQKHLSVQKLDRFEVPVAPLSRQDEMIDSLRSARRAAEVAASRAATTTELVRVVLRRALGATQ